MGFKLSVRVVVALCCFAGWSASCTQKQNPPASDAGLMDPKNRCIAPGIGGTCMCAPGRNGTNTCGPNGYWTACQCFDLPQGAKCREGEQLRCGGVCPGESSARMTQCVDGNYDCRCPPVSTSPAPAGATAGAQAGAGGAAAGAGAGAGGKDSTP